MSIKFLKIAIRALKWKKLGRNPNIIENYKNYNSGKHFRDPLIIYSSLKIY